MTALNNVNFDILLKMHNGNFQRAKQAWDKILSLGKFGSVPHTYEGGLDVQSLRVAREEFEERSWKALRIDPTNPGVPLMQEPVNTDDIKRIEDVATGDKPK